MGVPGKIGVVSNAFGKQSNEAQGWFSSLSFGIRTSAGFAGMTWSPDPNETRTLTPQLRFYVAGGSFSSNSLASWTTVSNKGAVVSVPTSFQRNACTVTLTPNGSWSVSPGAPPLFLGEALERSDVESGDVADAPVYPDAPPTLGETLDLSDAESRGLTQDTLVSVQWNAWESLAAVREIILTGHATVAVALPAGFSWFILSGIRFTINNITAGGTSVSFTYSGAQSADRIKSLFYPGSVLLFGR
jgi:hypothetical protein